MLNEHDLKDFPMTQGVKHDNNKPPIDLVDAEFIEGLAKVLGFGATKYARHNWRNGITYSRLIAAAYRHLGAINKGENLDDESGEPHVYHLACCVQFLSWMLTHRKDLDDRYKGTKNDNSLDRLADINKCNSIWDYANSINNSPIKITASDGTNYKCIIPNGSMA